MKKKILRIIMIIFVIYIYLLLYTPNIFGATFKFGIKKNDYENYFNQEYQGRFYALNSAQKEYSTLTHFNLPNTNEDSEVIIEHMVPVVYEDIVIIKDLKDKDNFFTAIEFKAVKVIDVKINNIYKDNELEIFNKYIYTKSEYGKTRWNVTPLEDKSIKDQDTDFAYVEITKIPNIQSSKIYEILIPKRFWFPREMKQQVEIIYIDKDGKENVVIYDFDLYWVRWWGVLERISTIT